MKTSKKTPPIEVMQQNVQALLHEKGYTGQERADLEALTGLRAVSKAELKKASKRVTERTAARRKAEDSQAGEAAPFSAAADALATRLVAESRRNRTPGPRSVDLTGLYVKLGMTLGVMLDSFDYEQEPESRPGMIARILATIVADLEDEVQRDKEAQS